MGAWSGRVYGARTSGMGFHMTTAQGDLSARPESPAGPQTLPRLKLLLLSSGYLIMGMTLLVVVGLAPLIQAELALEPRQTSILLSLFALVYALGAPAIQVYLAETPLRYLIAGGLVLASAGLGIMAAASNFEVLLAGRLLSAIGCATVGPSVAAFATAIAPPDRRAAALGTVFIGMTLANVAAVPLFAGLGLLIGWRGTFLTMALLSAAAVAIPLALQEPEGPRPASSLGEILRVLAKLKRVLALLVTNLQMASQFIVYSVMSTFIFSQTGTDGAILPFALLIFGAGGMFGNFLSTILSIRVRVETLITASLILLIGTFVMLATTEVSMPAFLLLIGLWSGSGMMMMAPQQARITTLTVRSPAQLLAVNLSMVYVGIAVGSWAGGTILKNAGVEMLLPAAITTAAVALICHLLSLKISVK